MKEYKIVVQNVDSNLTPKAYDKFGDDKILWTSIFRTVQGEGPYAGYPSVFLRLSGCNFGGKDNFCNFCDTNFQFDKGNLSTIEELADLVVKERKYASDILVITGGEPTLQKNLKEFIDTVCHHFSDVQIETNGTQVSYFKQYDVSEDTSYEDYPYYPLVVVSPKASIKAGKYPKLSDSVLKHATCLKFVLDSNPESPHHTVPEWALEWGKETGSTVYVSPMAIYAKAYEGEVSSIWEEGLIDKELTSMNYKYAAEYAMEHGLVVSTQQHLFYGLA